MSNCRWISSDRPRILPNRHEDGCVDECQGCVECTRPHCLVQWHGERGDCETHAESVCPSCLAKVREHLTEIVRLSGMPLLEQVLRTGDSDTEAADLLGPVANPQQWRQRSDYGHIYEPDARAGWHMHPEGVLGWFDMIVTSHLGHTRTQRITIASAATYLDSNLHFLAADVEFAFADMGGAFESCRRHLELVLHEGEQVETGAPCMKCEKPMLRVFGGRELPWSHRDGSKPLAADDCWACAKCREWRSEKDYRLNVADQHRSEAEWLPAPDMIERAEIAGCEPLSRGSLTGWASKGLVAKRTTGGRVVYRVSDVLERLAVTGDDAA